MTESDHTKASIYGSMKPYPFDKQSSGSDPQRVWGEIETWRGKRQKAQREPKTKVPFSLRWGGHALSGCVLNALSPSLFTFHQQWVTAVGFPWGKLTLFCLNKVQQFNLTQIKAMSKKKQPSCIHLIKAEPNELHPVSWVHIATELLCGCVDPHWLASFRSLVGIPSISTAVPS